MMPVVQFAERVVRNVETVIVGKRQQIELLMVALFCQGHVLIEDVPGTGKTMLARAVATSMGLPFKRLQCTPDLLPNDITGVSVYNQATNQFDFRPGPVFVSILLADEINRATPRSQAALLAFVLPTGFTLGFLEQVGNYLGVMGAVLFFFLRLILTVLIFPLAWLYWLLLTLLGEQRSPPESQLPTFEPPPPTPSGGGAAGWFEVVQTLIFWAVLLGAVFYVVRSYLRDRPELRATLTRLRPIHTLRRWWVGLWGWLWAWLTGVKRAAAERLPRRLSRRLPRGDSLKAPWRFFRLGALSPRERVRYYYLSILRRAGRQGHPRRRHQTPQEYYSTLEPNLPRSQEEMAALTAAFVEAQYSQHQVEPEQERRVRADWERVKAALRALKRRRETK